MTENPGSFWLRGPGFAGNPLAKIWLERLGQLLDNYDSVQLYPDDIIFTENNFLKLISEGIKNIFCKNNIKLWDLTGSGFRSNFLQLFYGTARGPDLNKLRETGLIELVEEEQTNGCCPAEDSYIFPWLSGTESSPVDKTICIIFAGRIYYRLFADLIGELEKIMSGYTFVLPEAPAELQDEFEVDILLDRGADFVPEYLWLWGYAPAMSARAVEWLGQSTVIAPASQPWLELLPDQYRELLYPVDQPWLGLPVIERLVRRKKERETLKKVSKEFRNQKFAPSGILEEKILPRLTEV